MTSKKFSRLISTKVYRIKEGSFQEKDVIAFMNGQFVKTLDEKNISKVVNVWFLNREVGLRARKSIWKNETVLEHDFVLPKDFLEECKIANALEKILS